MEFSYNIESNYIILGIELDNEINFNNDLTLKKINIEDFDYVDKITNSGGKLIFPYFLYDKIVVLYSSFHSNDVTTLDKNKELMHKKNQAFVETLNIVSSTMVSYINEFIETTEILGIQKNTDKGMGIICDFNPHAIDQQDKLFLDSSKVQLIENYILYYGILDDIISTFFYADKIIEDAVAIQIYCTVLEMLFIKNSDNNNGIKEMLSRRTSILISKNDAEIEHYYKKAKEVYKVRSNATHRGAYNNKTDADKIYMKTLRKETRELSRDCILSLLDYTINTYPTNNSFTEFKPDWVEHLKQNVISKTQVYDNIQV